MPANAPALVTRARRNEGYLKTVISERPIRSNTDKPSDGKPSGLKFSVGQSAGTRGAAVDACRIRDF